MLAEMIEELGALLWDRYGVVLNTASPSDEDIVTVGYDHSVAPVVDTLWLSICALGEKHGVEVTCRPHDEQLSKIVLRCRKETV